jgi:hypothetical protein
VFFGLLLEKPVCQRKCDGKRAAVYRWLDDSAFLERYSE